jgi:hypothetical protein
MPGMSDVTTPEDEDWVEIRSADGSVVRRIPLLPDPEEIDRQLREMLERGEMSMRRFRQAMVRLEESMRNLPPISAMRGGITFEYLRDPRQGEEVPVEDLTPGTKVFILEGVFTVFRVDMKAPIPTVWLEELPDSPLYFEHTDYIPLATNPKD